MREGLSDDGTPRGRAEKAALVDFRDSIPASEYDGDCRGSAKNHKDAKLCRKPAFGRSRRSRASSASKMPPGLVDALQRPSSRFDFDFLSSDHDTDTGNKAIGKHSTISFGQHNAVLTEIHRHPVCEGRSDIQVKKYFRITAHPHLGMSLGRAVAK